jgi:hypothetical protein
MPDTQQRFQMLAEQFAVLEHNLRVSQNAEQRAELLKGMMVVLNQSDDILTKDHSLTDSKPDSTAPSNPPLSKAAHQ